jgi:hypothetical protein
MALIRDHRALTTFFFAYYLGLLALGATAGRSQTVFYAAFMGIAAMVVAWLYGRVRFSSATLWCLAIWGLGHMAGGLVYVNGE